MKKFVCSIVLVFAVALICAACGSTDKKENGDAVAKSEEVKNEDEQVPQWVMDGGESASSDEEICAVGQSEATKRMIGPATQHAVSEAQLLLCQKVAIGNECNLPKSKMKKMIQSRVNEYGRIPIYVLVCINRKDLEENKKETEKETPETGNADETDKTDETDNADQTDEDKVVQ